MSSSIWYPVIQVEDTLLRQNLARVDNEEFGAGLIGYGTPLPYADGTVGKALNDLFTGFATVQNIVQEGYADIRDYGAVGDGVTPCDVAIAAALVASERIFIPAGNFLVTSPIILNKNNLKILGENRWTAKLLMEAAGGAVISVASGVTNLEINNLYVGRNVAAEAGGNGINFASFSSDSRLIDLTVENQHFGIALRGGWRCFLQRCVSMNNYSHGIVISADTTGLSGWDMGQCFSAYNVGSGYYITGVGAATGPISHLMGELIGCYALYNSSTGLTCIGDASNGMQSVRINGGVYSFNGADNIYLHTFSGRHRLTNLNANAAGTTLTGRQGSQIAASLAGNGIRVTANNQDITISTCIVQDNNYSGMHLTAGVAIVTGSTCLGNGKNTGASDSVRVGLRLETGLHIMTGNFCGNQSGTVSQRVGAIATAFAAGSRRVGNAMIGNSYLAFILNGNSSTDY